MTLDFEQTSAFENPTNITGLAPRPQAKVLLRIWRIPAHHHPKSYSVLQDNSEIFIRRIVWERKGLPTPVFPRIVASEGVYNPSTYSKLIGDLEKVPLPGFRDSNSIVLDGARIGFEVRANHLLMKLEWQEGMFEEYKSIETWLEYAQTEFDKTLPIRDN